jgi:GTP cyclohydrolase I
MGNVELSEEQLRRLRENIIPVTDLPTEPATPPYRIHDVGSTIVAPEGTVHAWNWDEVFKGARTEHLAAALLERFGVDTNIPHMKDTPRRFVQMMNELTQSEPFNFTTFDATSDEMIIEVGIPFYTLCAHHVIPFHGQAHVGYVPNTKLAGLSKFGRLVKNIAKGLWVQEELTAAIADALEAELEPRGVAVILRGEHMCMSMRGVQMPGVITQTAAMRGVFGDHSRTAKMEFLEAIRDHK